VLSEAKNHFSLLEMAFMYRAILSESSQTTLKPVTLNSLVDRYYCDYKDSKSASQDLLWIGSFKKTISMNNFLRKLECFDSGYTYVLLEILTIFIRYNGQGKDISNLDENEVERIAITMAICEEIDLGAKYRSKLLKAINECVTY
jgi:hypothetical protein